MCPKVLAGGRGGYGFANHLFYHWLPKSQFWDILVMNAYYRETSRKMGLVVEGICPPRFPSICFNERAISGGFLNELPGFGSSGEAAPWRQSYCQLLRHSSQPSCARLRTCALCSLNYKPNETTSVESLHFKPLHTASLIFYMEVSKDEGPFLAVPRIWILVYWGLYEGPCSCKPSYQQNMPL